MKKLSQKGALDVMLVAALVIVLAIGGFVLWRVTSANEEASDNTEKSNTTEDVETIEPVENTEETDADASTKNESENESNEAAEKETVSNKYFAFELVEGWSFAGVENEGTATWLGKSYVYKNEEGDFFSIVIDPIPRGTTADLSWRTELQDDGTLKITNFSLESCGPSDEFCHNSNAAEINALLIFIKVEYEDVTPLEHLVIRAGNDKSNEIKQGTVEDLREMINSMVVTLK